MTDIAGWESAARLANELAEARAEIERLREALAPDLVELPGATPVGQGAGPHITPRPAPATFDAIAGLEAEIDELRAAIVGYAARTDAMAAEIGRLRGALNWYADRTLWARYAEMDGGDRAREALDA